MVLFFKMIKYLLVVLLCVDFLATCYKTVFSNMASQHINKHLFFMYIRISYMLQSLGLLLEKSYWLKIFLAPHLFVHLLDTSIIFVVT